MSQSPREPQNPYQSPAVAAPVIDPAHAGNLRLHKLLKDFRAQILALGAFWVFIGLVAIVIGVLAGNGSLARDDNAGMIVMAIMGIVGLGWMLLGVMTCLKQTWAIYVALVLSYLSLISSLARFQICGIILLLVVILQAHRVLGWAKELRCAGIPLTTKPQDLEMKISVPA